MVTVRRQNVVLEIDDEDLEKYTEKGFDVLDRFGNVVRASVPADVGTLQKAYKEQEVIIAKQNEEIEKLKKEIETLVAAVGTSKPDSVKRTYNKKKQ